MTPRAAWAGPTLVGLLALTLSLIPKPSAVAADTPPAGEKQQKIEALKKQLAELQKQLAEMEKGEKPAAPASQAIPALPDSVSKFFTWRNIGPANMGGRVTSLAVVESEPTTYYIGTATGGLLKTINNGTTFEVLFDNQSTISIGDVAVAPSDPNIVWVGTGEANPRNSVSYGDGVYKSVDAGKTFTKMGLDKTYQIGRILIHPKDPNTVYVGALGRLYGDNSERGLFKTTDGGKTWDKVFFVDDKTGVIDARLDPTDPNTLVVAMWQRKRDQFDGFFGQAPVPDTYGPIVTFGKGGGLFKSSDAGKTWEPLKKGLPTVSTGRIGLDISRTTKGVLFAVIDTEKVGTGEPSAVYLGVTSGDAAAGVKGAKIGEVTKGGPADKSGLKAGDLVTKADETAIERYDDLVDYCYGKKPGDEVKLAVTRGDKTEAITLKLGKREPNTGAAATGPPVMGVTLKRGETGVVFATVAVGGPAAEAGVKAGDALTAIDGKPIKDSKAFTLLVRESKAGQVVELTLKRGTEEKKAKVTLGAAKGVIATLPLPGFAPEADENVVKVGKVVEGSSAAKAGIKAGDVVTKADGAPVNSPRSFLRALRVGPGVEDARQSGAKVTLTVKSGDKAEKEFELELVAVPYSPPAGGAARGATAGRPFGMGLGGQQPNVQFRQGENGFETGGLYKSADFGDTWTRVNSLNPRPMYFSVVRVDPSDDQTIYMMADSPTIYKSTNGGKRFEPMATSRGVHADAHAFWIDAKNPKHLVIGCDGGFYVSYDKGNTWDHLNTLALGQFYHVAVDNKKPYRVYGGLQDNGSWGGPSNSLRSYGPVNEDWVYVSGGDGFVCRVDPNDPDLVYAESQNGFMSRRNFRTGEFSSIRPPRKQGEEALRFNWNTPFMLSSHNPGIFYCGAQFVFKSVNKGEALKQISPDLTKSKKGSMTALAESPVTAGVLWAGTDDGNLWVSKDGGGKWDNVSENYAKAGVPGPRWVSSIEPSRDKEGRCYVVLDGHRSDDDKPYVLVTDDYGATFKFINGNLPGFGIARVLREDIVNSNVLYLGTEAGAWVSIDKGASWSPLGGNLPTVPVFEFAQPTTEPELVAGTHGRSVWVTDIAALRQIKPAVLKADVTLFTPATATRWKLGAGGESPYSVTDRRFVGKNPKSGASIDYYLAKPAKTVNAKIIDVAGKTIFNFEKEPTTAGLHRLDWNLAAARTTGVAGGGGRNRRPTPVGAGSYKVVLTVDGKEFTELLTVELDPNLPKDAVSVEGFEAADKDYQAERRAIQKPATVKRDE